ncbi:unnamed protein product, partial [Didymodactylos carnosus]
EIYSQSTSEDKQHFMQTRSSRDPSEICHITELYDPHIKNIKFILPMYYFPDEQFHTPSMLKFLKECGLRSYIQIDKCKQIMDSIQTQVKEHGWTPEQRKRSKYLYEHLLDNWQRYDNSILDIKFLEPYRMIYENDDLLQLHEQYTVSDDVNQLKYTCIKLSDGELLQYSKLCWTSSYLLPEFVRLEQYSDDTDQTQQIDQNCLDFFKLNKKPSYALVKTNLTNLCEKFSLKYNNHTQQKQKERSNLKSGSSASQHIIDDILIPVLKVIYSYFQTEIKPERRTEIYKELTNKECVYSRTRRQFLYGKYFCINLPIQDEIPPFLFSLPEEFVEYKSFFQQIGAQQEPHPMLYGDILRKLSKVCDTDYLNSNELCKSLKAMECFFKYLSTNSTITAQYKLPGLYLVSNDFKLIKSIDIVIMDDKTKLDYMTKLVHDKFMFNPNERVLKLDQTPSSSSTSKSQTSTALKDIIDKIFVSQRPILFTQKYEESFSITIPEDEESHRQRFLFNLERKYNQLLASRHLHRCMARVIANHVARQTNPKIISLDDVENLIRQRLTYVKVTCVEYLETNLIYKKTQQKVDQSVDEKAVYLVAEGEENIVLYISMKHTEQPYFTLCLARALSPCLGLSELQLDNSVMAALLATTIGQMSKLLNLVNVATDENILSILKMQYIPSPGNVYGDDIEALQVFSIDQHQILPGDLCVYKLNDLYIYCEVERIIKEHSSSSKKSSSGKDDNDEWSWKKSGAHLPSYTFICKINENNETQRIEQDQFYVLEHWSRIFDAVSSVPPDERESSKFSTDSKTSRESSASGASKHDRDAAGGDGTHNTHNFHFSSSNHNSSSANHRSSRHHRGKGDSKTDSGPAGTNGHSSYTRTDSDSSNGTGYESPSESESSSNTAQQQDLIDKKELEDTKSEIYMAVRNAYQQTGPERKKTVKKLLLKWHPDKNRGRERFAAEVFKHLRKQIDHFENDPLTSDPKFSWNKTHKTESSTGAGDSATADSGAKPSSSSTSGGTSGDYFRYGSFENDDVKRSYQDIPRAQTTSETTTDSDTQANGGGAFSDGTGKTRFSPHRSSSFRTAREEWAYRRQHGFQRRHGFFSGTEEQTTNGSSGTTNGAQSGTQGSM